MRDGDKLMVVGAVYALNLAIFVAFGVGATQIWLDVAATVAVGLLAYRLTRIGAVDLKPFFALLVLASLFNLANLIVWRTGLSVPGGWSTATASNDFPLYYGFLGLFLFFWDCAWFYLTVTLVRRQGFGLANWIALLVLLGFVGIYVAQFRSFGFDVSDAQSRVLSMLFLLELVGVLLGVMCALLGATRPYLFMVVGFAVFAAIHIVGIRLQLNGDFEASARLQPLWTLGRAFVLAGIWLLFRAPATDGALSMPPPGAAARTVALVDPGRQSSQLSSLLIVFALGAVFVVAAFEHYLRTRPEWFGMFFVLFCVTCAIFMSLATSRLDRAIGYVRKQMVEIFTNKLALIATDDRASGIERTLQLTGLDAMLAQLRRGAVELRDGVVVLGPERLNRPPGQHSAGSAPRCFIVMPFGAPWSPTVSRLIRGACKRCGVQAIRGDDIFSPTDILDDIWQQIIAADFVIADVTDRNTNVFYELGMAHAVGKPVIILAQREDDVPIDLKTRRWLPYDPEQGEALGTALHQSITQVLEMYHLRAPAGEVA